MRREPEGTVLYRAVQAAWGSFVGGVEANERSVPRFCTREVDAFMRCGVLAHGFAACTAMTAVTTTWSRFRARGGGFARHAERRAWWTPRRGCAMR